MKRPAVLIMTMFAWPVVAVPVLRASPGPEPLQYDATPTAPASDWDISSAVVSLGVLAFAGGVVAISARRQDKMRTTGVLGNTPAVRTLAKDAAACGKDANALDALASVG